MKAFAALLLVSALFSTHVFADWDPELEAQEAAERTAQQKKEQAQKAEADRQVKAAQAKADSEIMASKRKSLGAAANGKSDADVNKLYNEKTAKASAEAQKAIQSAKNNPMMTTQEADSAAKSVTGKNMQELENMSDEDLDALEKQMQEKYGKQ